MFDFHALAAAVDKDAAWAGTIDASALKPYCSLDQALKVTLGSYRDSSYVDSHCWVFTPTSFLALCAALADLRLLQWRLVFLRPTQRGDEDFGLVLERTSPESATEAGQSFRLWLAAA